MAKGKNTVALVTEIAKPIAENLGLSLWDVRYQKEGSQWYLRVFIDKEGAVGIDDCVNMSHALDEPLDELNPTEGAYVLEVSSPGVERDLVKEEHFLSNIGEKIKVKMIRPIDGKREFFGVLESYDEGNITLRADDGSGFTFVKKETSYIKLDDFNIQ